MKTTIVHFSYGTVKNAALKIPAEAYSIIDAAQLIRESYLDYAFRPGCGLMSDEVLTSSIGKSNFFAGALGGYEQRLKPEVFAALKRCADSDEGQAIFVARYRDPEASQKAIYLRAAQNSSLSEDVRRFLTLCAKDADDITR